MLRSMSPLYRAPRGTVDVLPQEQPYWQHVYQTAARLCQLYGYSQQHRRPQLPAPLSSGSQHLL